MSSHEQRDHAVALPRKTIDPIAAARLVTWSVIGGLSLFFYFGVS